MTRFNITIDDAVRRAYWCIDNLSGGEVYVPKIPSYRIMDLAKSINHTSSKKLSIKLLVSVKVKKFMRNL